MKTIYKSLLIAFASFILLTPLRAQIPNNDFLNWTLDVDSNLNPDGWETSNLYPDISVLPASVVCDQDISMRIRTLLLGGSFVIPGFASLGFHSSLRPTCLSFSIKANVMSGDEVIIFFSAYDGNDSLVASPDSCTFKLNNNIATCTNINLPIKYLTNQTIDSMNISIIVGRPNNAQAGTEITIDDLSFNCITTNTDQSITKNSKTDLFPNPAHSEINLSLPASVSGNISIRIMDMQGKETERVIRNITEEGQRVITVPVVNLADGMYYFLLKGNQFEQIGKFIVNR
jgi:hypothetical protein